MRTTTLFVIVTILIGCSAVIVSSPLMDKHATEVREQYMRERIDNAKILAYRMSPVSPKTSIQEKTITQEIVIDTYNSQTDRKIILAKKNNDDTVKIIPNKQVVAAPKNDNIAKQLGNAAMAFSAPTNANLDDQITIQLLIDPSKDIKTLEKILKQQSNVTSETIRVSKIVTVKLSAPDFTIVHSAPEEQAVADAEPTEWIWVLEPKIEGKHKINISVTATVTVGNKTTKHFLNTYNKDIDITIEPRQRITRWFNNYWQWLIGTIIFPILVWFLKDYILKKSD